MLPFTAEIFFANLAQYQQAIWPAQLAIGALVAAALVAFLRPARFGGRTVGTILAILWVWIGLAYQARHFAAINFLAPAYALVFVLQAALLVWNSTVRDRVDFRWRADIGGWTALALIVLGLAWPLLDALDGRGWASLRLPGLAPGPTALLTLGLLLPGARSRAHLAALPVLWTLISGATGWVLAIPQDVVFPAAALGAVALVAWGSLAPGATERSR